jgi:hypothetical protein
MAERLNASVLKTEILETVSGVRIPVSPLIFKIIKLCFGYFTLLALHIAFIIYQKDGTEI